MGGGGNYFTKKQKGLKKGRGGGGGGSVPPEPPPPHRAQLCATRIYMPGSPDHSKLLTIFSFSTTSTLTLSPAYLGYLFISRHADDSVKHNLIKGSISLHELTVKATARTASK